MLDCSQPHDSGIVFLHAVYHLQLNLCSLKVQAAKPKGTWVLVLGLEGAGKTSVLHCFATGSLEQDVSPTEGFNAVSISKEDLQIEFLESKYCQ